MPTSPWNNIQPIIDAVMTIRPRPKRILDVGIGFGKFGLLCREYISYWNSPSEMIGVSVDGIEAFPEYIGPIQHQIYDNITIGDAKEILPALKDKEYDLLLMIDVLEHFEPAEGRMVLQECRRVAKVAIVSTPRTFWPQQDAWDNTYERHRSLWSRRDLLRLGAARVLRAENWIAIFAAPPYHRVFSRSYRLWQYGNRWTPTWLRPGARWVFRTLTWKADGR